MEITGDAFGIVLFTSHPERSEGAITRHGPLHFVQGDSPKERASTPYRFALPISGAPVGGSYARSRSSSTRGSVSTMIVSRCAWVRNSSATA